MNDGSAFQFDSYYKGYHAYMNIWEPLLGERLKCVKEPTNEVDKHAVAVVRINSQLRSCCWTCAKLHFHDCIHVFIITRGDWKTCQS